MKRLFIGLVAGVLIGGIAGFGLGIFVYPFWFLNDVAQETLASNVERTRLAAGNFTHVDVNDPVHYGAGGVTVYREPADRTIIFLHENFEVGPGPRFHVYLVNHADVRSRSDFLDSDKVDLGRLRAFRGSQVYNVPGGTDVARFESVVIWCKEFGVLISPASLAFDSKVQKISGETRRIRRFPML